MLDSGVVHGDADGVGIAFYEAAGGDGSRYETAGSDDAVVADMGAFQDDGIGGNPAAVADGDGLAAQAGRDAFGLTEAV